MEDIDWLLGKKYLVLGKLFRWVIHEREEMDMRILGDKSINILCPLFRHVSVPFPELGICAEIGSLLLAVIEA